MAANPCVSRELERDMAVCCNDCFFLLRSFFDDLFLPMLPVGRRHMLPHPVVSRVAPLMIGGEVVVVVWVGVGVVVVVVSTFRNTGA